MTEPKEYDLIAIRNLLLIAFNPQELREIFYFAENQDLRAVIHEFVDHDSLPTMIYKAVSYCERHDLLSDLLAAAKQKNPRQYAVVEGEIGGFFRPRAAGERAAPAPAHAEAPPGPERIRPYRKVCTQIEPQMVLVRAGPFIMGTSDEQVQAMLARYDWAKKIKKRGWFDNELPQHEVTLPTYEIGRYPVTNAEYASFVKATGHDAPRSLVDKRPFEEYPADHPVVHVTWHDAVSYAEWLREQTGQPYRLPTEAEWEKAARGNDGRLWPWGDQAPDQNRCNFVDHATGTTPVDQYSPAGDSPYGCADMAGNVEEWCSTLRQDYPYRADDGRESLDEEGIRIYRGGGAWCNPGLVRCASRSGNGPYVTSRFRGFRVARGPLEGAR